jgi:hypothetical protein
LGPHGEGVTGADDRMREGSERLVGSQSSERAMVREWESSRVVVNQDGRTFYGRVSLYCIYSRNKLKATELEKE